MLFGCPSSTCNHLSLVGPQRCKISDQISLAFELQSLHLPSFHLSVVAIRFFPYHFNAVQYLLFFICWLSPFHFPSFLCSGCCQFFFPYCIEWFMPSHISSFHLVLTTFLLMLQIFFCVPLLQFS